MVELGGLPSVVVTTTSASVSVRLFFLLVFYGVVIQAAIPPQRLEQASIDLLGLSSSRR
jgi:hypothetical protein